MQFVHETWQKLTSFTLQTPVLFALSETISQPQKCTFLSNLPTGTEHSTSEYKIGVQNQLNLGGRKIEHFEIGIFQGDFGVLQTTILCENCRRKNGNSADDDKKICLHCEKILCSPCMTEHIHQLRSHLSEISRKMQHTKWPQNIQVSLI